MNYRAVLRYMGQVLSIEGLFMLPALLVCLLYGEGGPAKAFVLCILLTLGLGFGLSRIPNRFQNSGQHSAVHQYC